MAIGDMMQRMGMMNPYRQQNQQMNPQQQQNATANQVAGNQQQGGSSPWSSFGQGLGALGSAMGGFAGMNNPWMNRGVMGNTGYFGGYGNNPQFNNWQQNMNSVLGRMGQAGQNMQNQVNPILSQLQQAQRQGNTGINPQFPTQFPTNPWWNNAHTMDLPTSSMYSNAGDIANRGGNPNDPSQWQGWQGKTPLWQQQGGFTGMMNPGMTGGFQPAGIMMRPGQDYSSGAMF